ncbi:hypothetical protein [Roseospira goensis]|uniref:Ribbon-helix-helix protein, CopG family n=1 Tax=Roseospira goensis TaxID=391922 RepID=A0A7W6S1L0_9PROT|nr:hypothetical protein [Roseospira goensis]MBB4286497.1 hypothetical protein [Roseospira goensis]
MTKARVQFDLTPERLAELDHLMAVCGFETRKELFNTALSFFEAAVEEARKGNDIAAVNEEAQTYSRLVLPALARVTRSARRDVAAE